MTPTIDAPARARALRHALEGLAGALMAGDVTAVLGQEAVLSAALNAPSHASHDDHPEDQLAMVRDLTAARAALARCRALGAASADLTRVTLEALAGPGAYSRQGAEAPRSPRGRDLHARV